MNIIPIIRCEDMAKSIRFYTTILDFEWHGTWPAGGASQYSILTRGDGELHLSTFKGDGKTGNRVVILADDIDGLFRKYLARGLDVSANKESPVHQGPLIQTWGTREFYVDDPSGNTLRFIER